MSNPILTSNQSSAVVATINESTTKNPWVYNETNRLTVPHAMQILNIDPSSGSVGASKTHTYDVAKNGVCQGMWLKFKFLSITATDGTGDNPAPTTEPGAGAFTGKDSCLALGLLQCIDNIRLTTSGRIIERLDKYQILARYADLPHSVKQDVVRSCRMGMDPPTGSEFFLSMYLPFYFTVSHERYGILTNFEEPHRVEVTLGDCKWFSLNTAQPDAHAPESCSLLCHYRQLDEPQMNEIVSKNYGDGLLSRVVQISKTEAEKVGKADSGKDITVDLKENEAVRAMYVMVIEDDVTAAKSTTATAIDDYMAPLEVDHFTLTFNNTTVLDVPGEFVRHFGRWCMSGHNGDGSVVGFGTNGLHHVYKIDFGLDKGKELTNVVAFRELSNPRLRLTLKQNQTTNTKVHVIYETATFLSCSSSTGRVQLSISS